MPVESLRLRVASLEDSKRLYDWSAALAPDAAPLWGRPVWEDHQEWFERLIGPTDTLLFMGEAERTDEVIGAICFRAARPAIWGVEVIIGPGFRGRGWSSKLLRLGLDHLDPATFLARVGRSDSHAHSLFTGAGFSRIGGALQWDVLRRNAPTLS